MLRYLWVSAVVLAADQLTKWAAMKILVHGEVSLLPFLKLTLVFNTGAAFGLLSDAPGWQNRLFMAVAVMAAVIIYFMLRRLTRNEWLTAVGLALILGGALGNLVDRALYGYVIDFIDLFYPSAALRCPWPFSPHDGGCHWPVFNLADAAITGGAVLLVLDVFGLGAAVHRPDANRR
jgi:signal peptidase II